MKLFRFVLPLLTLVNLPVFAGDLKQHFQLPLVEAYIDNSVDQEPDIPGMGKVNHYICVSLSTIDDQTSAFAVYVRLKMADGSSRAIRTLIERDSVFGNSTTARFDLGKVAPVKTEAFYIVRMHSDQTDHFVRP